MRQLPGIKLKQVEFKLHSASLSVTTVGELAKYGKLCVSCTHFDMTGMLIRHTTMWPDLSTAVKRAYLSWLDVCTWPPSELRWMTGDQATAEHYYLNEVSHFGNLHFIICHITYNFTEKRLRKAITWVQFSEATWRVSSHKCSQFVTVLLMAEHNKASYW